jgi:hypothetical protein
MSDRPSGNGKPPDPFEQWRTTRDAYVEAWASALSDALKNEASQNASTNSGSRQHATDAVLETLLTASAPFRETLQKITTVTLEQLGIPTRDDVAEIAEHMSAIEKRLEDMHDKMDRIEKLLSRPTTNSRKSTRARAVKRRAK